jgi:hypothetical protein
MEGMPAIYNGKIVSKNHFRTFIYSPEGSQKLVESWDEYEKCMESGLWLSSQEEALKIKNALEDAKQTEKVSKKKTTKQELPEFQDDFLPRDE